MIISDLSYLETIASDTDISGGYAFADAYSSAFASGPNFAATYTSTRTSATRSFEWYYYYSQATASSGSSSSSVAY